MIEKGISPEGIMPDVREGDTCQMVKIGWLDKIR